MFVGPNWYIGINYCTDLTNASSCLGNSLYLTNYNPGVTYFPALNVQTDGTSGHVNVYLNGTFVFTYTIPTSAMSGQVGIYTQGSETDDSCDNDIYDTYEFLQYFTLDRP